MFLKSEFFKDVSVLIYVAFLSRLKLGRQFNLQNMSCKRQCLLWAVCVTGDVHTRIQYQGFGVETFQCLQFVYLWLYEC